MKFSEEWKYAGFEECGHDSEFLVGDSWLRHADEDIDDWGELLTSLLRWVTKQYPRSLIRALTGDAGHL